MAEKAACPSYPFGVADSRLPRGRAVNGVKLDTLLGGRRDRTRREQFLMHYPHAPHRSDYWTNFRDGDWKAIYHYFPSEASEQNHYQLFNLKADPLEQKNLAASRPVELRRIMQALISSLEEHHALYPVDKDGSTPLKPRLPRNTQERSIHDRCPLPVRHCPGSCLRPCHFFGRCRPACCER